MLSSLALAGLVLVVAARSGGIASFAVVWLVTVPLEATISLSRRVVLAASAMAASVAGLLWGAGALNLFPPLLLLPQEAAPLAGLGIVSVLLFTTAIALLVEQLARTSALLHRAEEDRYRLLAQNMTDVITRHDRNGAVLFVSPTAEQMLGAKTEDLHGQGLFDRVHVADRPG
jgi:cell cycle sensor histidine kinase DivJ